jgi:hypothetical protein
VDFFNLSNPSSRTMALGLTQPLTEISTRILPGGVKDGRRVRLKILPPFVGRLSRNYGSLDLPQPYGPPLSVTWDSSNFLFLLCFIKLEYIETPYISMVKSCLCRGRENCALPESCKSHCECTHVFGGKIHKRIDRQTDGVNNSVESIRGSAKLHRNNREMKNEKPWARLPQDYNSN